MRYFKILLIFCLATSLVVGDEDEETSNPIVTTKSGKVHGNMLKSVSGRGFHAFRGIRYAQPPIGPLRFTDPLPVEPWSDVFDATKDGPMCPQPWNNTDEIDEDCLRLNIYTHNLLSDSVPISLKPVIVWLHPGGFYVMSAHSQNFAGPQYFMDRNIVLVTMNYRLGSLGFLATGTADAPGNAGLKDQVIGLRWLKENIEQFGGDPNVITLLGYSAGAVSIGLHMMSPMSKGLFQRAIIMSGSVMPKYEVPSDQLFLAQKQARLLNCTDSNISEMVNCMKTKPYTDFSNTLGQMFWIGGLPILLFRPVIEPDFGQERFLLEDPNKAYQEGRFMRIPVITGRNKDEFVGIAIDVLSSNNFRQNMDENWEEYAPIVFHYDGGTARSRNISNTLRDEFLGPGPLTFNGSLDGMSKLFIDGINAFSTHRFVHLAAQYTTIYYYYFTYQGRWSYLYYPDDEPYGVVHHDDTLYLFVRKSVAPIFTEDYPEHVTMERLTRMWTAFAYTGDPNDSSDKYLRSVYWLPFTCVDENYLEIGDNLEMKCNLYIDRFSVWERLFPLPLKHDEEHSNKHHTCPKFPNYFIPPVKSRDC